MTLRTFSAFSAMILCAVVLALSDHLSSQSLAEVVAPHSAGQSCAPCGAPCK